jgi:hypothetical protein
MRNMLLLMATAPEGQIEISIREELEMLLSQPETTWARELKRILDKCVHCSSCSDFCVVVLDHMVEEAEKQYGSS